MNKLKKAMFLTSNLKMWLGIIVFGLIMFAFAFFIGFLPYFERVTNFLLKKLFVLASFNTSLRAIIASVLFLVALLGIIYSLYKIYKFFSGYNNGLFENTYRESKLSKGKKIVTIGGGTGSYTLLNGLKELTSNITAVVTTMDSGGSSQLLKTEFGVLPPGDIRNCVIALSSLPDKLRNVFNKRFKKTSSLVGHPLGNLFLTRLAQDEGFEVALEQMEELLQCRGKVLPVTNDKVELIAINEKDEKFYGESEIDKKALNIKEIFLNQKANANSKVIDAIKDADTIVLGPGSLFSSIIPNLLVNDICDAINNSKAKKVFVMPVMSQYPETHGFKAEHYMNWIERYVNIDYFLINNKKPSDEILNKYLPEKKFYIDPITGEKDRYIKADLINEKTVVRHDSEKLAKLIIKI